MRQRNLKREERRSGEEQVVSCDFLLIRRNYWKGIERLGHKHHVLYLKLNLKELRRGCTCVKLHPQGCTCYNSMFDKLYNKTVSSS
uniref:Uncharacterized protein n=1 Tax=Engystomops pustulosus TaxID=76066 RepID=A0AAV6YZF0_ENGPU|nr:hypothetical protein GDO81_029447 [Engystomops pustulosus]